MCCKCECTCNSSNKLEQQVDRLTADIRFLNRANASWKEQNLTLQRDLSKAKATVRELRTTIKTLITFKEEENGYTSC